VRDGDDVWFYYFGRADAEAHAPSGELRRSAVHRVRLVVDDGLLVLA
jgi:hypothetical protein